MMTETKPFHIVRILFDIQRLLASARLERLPLRHVDIGYLIHCELTALFGDQAPKPFSVRGVQSRHAEVLGYSAAGADDLTTLAAESRSGRTTPTAYRWSDLASKQMPCNWHAGAIFKFELRACPVARMDKDGPRHRKGAEVDVFLARCWAAGVDVKLDRETVYREWLDKQVSKTPALKILGARLQSFTRNRLIRRTQETERQARVCERPDALFSGTLAVMDPRAFDALLRHGIGRHRAFGFGMFLLRPQRREPC